MRKGLFIRIDCDIRQKPRFQDIIDETGVSEAEALGSMTALWCYFQQNTEDGAMQITLPKLARRLGCGTVEFWEGVAAQGWLEVDEESATISVPDWDQNFWEGSKEKADRDREQATGRQRRHRQKASGPPHDDRNADVTRDTSVTENPVTRDTSVTENPVTKCHGPRIEENRKEKEHTQKIDRTEAAPAAGLSVCLSEFWENLSRAGISLPAKQPFWLRQSLSNGQSATMLAASRQLPYTGLTEPREGKPAAHLGNFKNADWVSRLAAGDFNIPGKGPPPPPVDPEEEYVMFHPAGAKMKRKDIRAWMADPANKVAYEAYKARHERDAGRDKARASGEQTSEPIPEGVEIPRAVLKGVNESFDTEAARESQLAAIAKWQERNG